jgi:HSP20 family protein
MLMQNDPFDSLFSRFERVATGAPMTMPMDAYRRGSDVWVQIDLPGVTADSVDITVERSVLTVSAERSWHREEGDQIYLAERQRGGYRRQVQLGDGLDADGIEADFTDGVLTLRIPVAEQAKPRKIEIGSGRTAAIDAAASSTTT